jgi:uncharacterized membrane protein
MQFAMKRFSVEDKCFVVLALVYAAMRFSQYTAWSLTNDELSALMRLRYDSIGDLINLGVRENDMHPMGVQLLMWIWTSIFGISASVVRLPFVLMGVGTLVFFYRAAGNFFGKPSALLASGIFSFLQYPAMYAELARPYSPGLFFSMLMLYGLSVLMSTDNPRRWMNAMAFFVGGVGCMYSHYFSFLFAALLGVSSLFLVRKGNILLCLSAGLGMLLCYVPSIDVITTHLSVGGLGGPGGWLGRPGNDALWKYLVHGFNQSPWFISVLVFAIVLYGAQRGFRFQWTRIHAVLLVLFVLIPLIAYYYSLWFNPVFQYSVLLFSFPLGLIVLCSGFNPDSWRKSDVFFCSFLTGLTLLTYFGSAHDYREGQFASFRRVADGCKEVLSTYNADSTDATVNVIHPGYIEYYTGNEVNFLQSRCNSPEDYMDLQRIVDSSNATYFLHAWANNYHAPETEWIIQEKFPYCIRRDTLFNAGLIVYTRDSTLKRVTSPPVAFEERNGFEALKWENEQWCRTDSICYSGRWAMRLERNQPYSPGIKRKASEMGLTKDAVYFISCKALTSEPWKEAKLVFSIERNGQSILWRGVPLSDLIKPNSSWSGFFAGYKLQEEVKPDDNVAVYFYNPAAERFFIDDFRMQVIPAAAFNQNK